MSNEDVVESHPLRVLDDKTGLPDAEMSLLLARSGVGKSAAMINFALDTLIQGGQVLHFCAAMHSEKVHEYYQEIFKDLSAQYPNTNAVSWDYVNNHLTVVSYSAPEKMVADISAEVATLYEGTHHKAALLIVDGLDFGEQTDHELEVVRNVASKHEVKTLASLRIHRKPTGDLDMDSPLEIARRHASHVYFMEPVPEKDHIDIDFMTADGPQKLPLFFCPHDLIFKMA